jgi:hypothetical protein
MEIRSLTFQSHCKQFVYLNRTELLTSIRNSVCDRNVIAQVKNQQQCSGDEKQTWPGRLHRFLYQADDQISIYLSRASAEQPKVITEPNPASAGLKNRGENIFP